MKVNWLGMFAACVALAVLPQPARADSPTCTAPEVKLSWPAVDPVWELCWVAYGQSSGPRGSGLELRNVHYNGRLVLKRAHSPLLFAEYTSGTCYRDWKDVGTSFVAEPAVRNQLGTSVGFNATTSCDRSSLPTTSYGSCPFQLPGRSSGDCFTGVAIEEGGDHVTMTASYSADWYYYASRFTFNADGSFDPEFGFGNRDGTGNGTTHWHHNYWRLDFDIEGADNDRVLQNDVVQASEFATLRCNASTSPACATERDWSVVDSVTGRGYRLLAGAADYKTPTNQSGRNLHLRDVIGAIYKNGEYGDRANNSLSDCTMVHDNLANGEDLDGATGAGTDVVLYYRAGVRDRTNEGAGTQDSMVCKKVGPVFVPIGDWSVGGPRPDPLYADGFE